MTNARQIAFDLLNQVSLGRQPLDYWLDEAEPRITPLNKADRALVHALVYGTLRWQSRLDYCIDHLASKPGKIDAQVRIILRMALFQMQHLDRIPVSAAVHTAVEMTKQNEHAWSAGFVNGLLRNAIRNQATIPWPDPTVAPELALAVRHALPRWLAKRWLARFGPHESGQLGDAINSIPPITLRANSLKTDRANLLAAIGEETLNAVPTEHTPEGIVLNGVARPLPQWRAFQDGWFQVQDEAAQLVAHFMAPLPGEAIWDACAGLGTKTAHLAQLMDNRGTLIATDLNAGKLDRLNKEMQRLGVDIVSSRRIDLEGPCTALDDLPLFDRILVDAPCSGLGVLQKNPDGKWTVNRADLKRCQRRQIALLDKAGRYLRPGGILVYAVCSFEPEENEAVVNAFLQNRPEFVIHSPSMNRVTRSDRVLTPRGWLNTFPHRHRMDGFFAAAFVKKA
jgi:16S rRNA (cytosine967-C5)-methyltransferase